MFALGGALRSYHVELVCECGVRLNISVWNKEIKEPVVSDAQLLVVSGFQTQSG